MKVSDQLFNWLQIHLVCRRFPDDEAARETQDFFWKMLQEDCRVSEVEWQEEDGDYTVCYWADGEKGTVRFDRFAVEKLVLDLESEPRYRQ